jgi:replicative DNA helicase
MSLNMDMLQTAESEAAVLGSVFVNNQVLDDIAEMLEPRDFTIEAHELIWKAMQFQYKRNLPSDIVTITAMLQQYGRLEEVGGVSYLAKLSSSTPSATNARHYAGIVQSRSYRRRANEAGIKIAQLSMDADYSDDEVLFQEVERLALSVRPNVSGDMKSLAEARQEYFDFLGQKDDFLNTGFAHFDEWMGGIGRGWLYILAGRPSVGKTAKMLQMMRGIAEQDAGHVLLWSQEMKRNQLLNRMIAPVSGISGNRIRRKEMDESEFNRLHNAYDLLEKLPLHIEDARNVTIDEVRAAARQFKRKHGRLGAIFVDYLTIMKIIQQKGETRSQAVGYVTRTAKQIALELDCPFIMLAQLSREGKDEPKLEHLRDSGEIEQDADVVEFLWHNPEDTHRDGKVIQSIIAKGRDVGVNQFKYLFKGWIQKYEELAT